MNYKITQNYHRKVLQKKITFVVLIILGLLLSIYAVSKGSYRLSLIQVVHGLIGNITGNPHLVVWNIRMPRIIAAIMAGWGLSLSGLMIQSLLKNPLGSPSTLGISQGAAFGASIGIIFFDFGTISHIYSVTTFAFLGAMTSTLVILMLAKLKKLSPESIILAGVALSSLFSSGTILAQYAATETQIVSALFWSFGDVARSGWKEIGIMSLIVIIVSIWVNLQRWNFNALLSGEETAKGLGVSVESLRIRGMIIATLVSAVITAFHGVIAFLGLLAPHIAKRIVGADHRLLIPFSCCIGSILLLLADTAGRIFIGSGNLPVGVLTSFLGAPMFLYLLVQGKKECCCH